MTATQHSHERTALITGASRGIGYELTNLCASDGYDLVLVARSRDKLERTGAELEDAHNVTATVIAKDLSVPGAAEELHEEVTARDIQVDTLVNNAGIGMYGQFCETGVDRIREILQLNLVTVTELTRLFARSMCERGSGRILNVGSLAGEYPSPKATVYAATKAYVISLSVALANELADDGITVTVLVPAETDTAILDKGGVEDSALPEKNLLSAQEVAQSGYDGLRRGKAIVVPGGVKQKLLFQLPRILPKTTVAATARGYWETE